MYYLTIKQPWASLLCSGFIDAWDFGTDVGEYVRHVFVVAAPKQQSKKCERVTIEWSQQLYLAEIIGAVPFVENLTYEKVIGVLEISRSLSPIESIWTYKNPSSKTVYRILNAYTLQTPKDLESLHPKYLRYNFNRASRITVEPNRTIRIPLCFHNFDNCWQGNTLTLPLTKELENLLFFKGKRIWYKYVVVVHNNQERIYKYEKDNFVHVPRYDGDNEVTVYSDIEKRRVLLRYFVFNLRTLI